MIRGAVTSLARLAASGAVLAFAALRAQAGDARGVAPTPGEVDAIYSDVEALYIDLHQHPELAFQETRTAAKLAGIMTGLGFDVTAGVGRTGIVAVMKNGPGPVAMLRTDLDALPVASRAPLAIGTHSEHPGVGVTRSRRRRQRFQVRHAGGVAGFE